MLSDRDCKIGDCIFLWACVGGCICPVDRTMGNTKKRTEQQSMVFCVAASILLLLQCI